MFVLPSKVRSKFGIIKNFFPGFRNTPSKALGQFCSQQFCEQTHNCSPWPSACFETQVQEGKQSQQMCCKQCSKFTRICRICRTFERKAAQGATNVEKLQAQVLAWRGRLHLLIVFSGTCSRYSVPLANLGCCPTHFEEIIPTFGHLRILWLVNIKDPKKTHVSLATLGKHGEEVTNREAKTGFCLIILALTFLGVPEA